MKQLRITVDGKSYDVSVEVLEESNPAGTAPSAPAPVRSAVVRAPVAAPIAAPKPTASAAGPGTVVSPLAGKVVSIDVAVGDAVNAGDRVATIEAMKMNTFIYAESDGTVAEVTAEPGQMVDEGAALLKLS